MKIVLSPRELSEALGVSESSVKRWVDRGVIAASRTAGGHRRITIEEAIRFVRETDREVAIPEALGLEAGADSWDAAFQEALDRGDAHEARGLIWSMHVQGMSVAEICDGPVRTAMEAIAEGWRRRSDAVFREHLATDICVQAISQLRTLSSRGGRGPVAVGGAPAGDPYILPSMMVAAVLDSVGFSAWNLGPDTPERTLENSVDVIGREPALVWLSVSATDLSRAEVEGARRLAASLADTETTMVVGGRARQLLDPLPESVMQVDSMEALVAELGALE